MANAFPVVTLGIQGPPGPLAASVANAAALGTTPDYGNTSAAWPTGTRAYTQDAKAYWTLDRTSTATPDGSTVVAAQSGVGRWILDPLVGPNMHGLSSGTAGQVLTLVGSPVAPSWAGLGSQSTVSSPITGYFSGTLVRPDLSGAAIGLGNGVQSLYGEIDVYNGAGTVQWLSITSVIQFAAANTSPGINHVEPSTDTAPLALAIQAQGAYSGATVNKNGADLHLEGGAPAAGGQVGYVDFHNAPTTTTAPAAGGAGALPATPAGYMQIKVGGTTRLVPYY